MLFVLDIARRIQMYFVIAVGYSCTLLLPEDTILLCFTAHRLHLYFIFARRIQLYFGTAHRVQFYFVISTGYICSLLLPPDTFVFCYCLQDTFVLCYCSHDTIVLCYCSQGLVLAWSNCTLLLLTGNSACMIQLYFGIANRIGLKTRREITHFV